MIKITFEINEDFIRESAKPESLSAKIAEDGGKRGVKALFDMIGFGQLVKQMDKGKTEFVVNTDKLDDKSKELFNNEVGEICMLAAFSETDNQKKED